MLRPQDSATRETKLLDGLWAFVTDPQRVGQCLPDVIDITVPDPTHFDAVVRVGVGPVRGNFKLRMELVPDQSGRRIDMKISGGGFGSTVDLTAGADVEDNGPRARSGRRRPGAGRAGTKADRSDLRLYPSEADCIKGDCPLLCNRLLAR